MQSKGEHNIVVIYYIWYFIKFVTMYVVENNEYVICHHCKHICFSFVMKV